MAGLACRVVMVCLMACSGCVPDATQPTDGSARTDRTFTILFTGNTLSTLKPCGCTERQLGGLQRRASALEMIPPQKRLLVDTGNFLRKDSAQDRIKMEIIFQSLGMMEYDLINLTADDLATATALGMTTSMPFPMITPDMGTDNITRRIPDRWTKTVRIGSEELEITIASASIKSPLPNIKQLFAAPGDRGSLNILITDNCSREMVEYITEVGIVDVVICPATATEPRIVVKSVKRPLFIAVGQLGEYLARLDITLTSDNRIGLDFGNLPIHEDLHEDDDLVQLYKDYQQIVKEEDLLGAVGRVPLAGVLKYAGSESCKACHKYAYKKWAAGPHANAYRTSVRVGSQYDPECIRCHVVGFGYETGFESEKSPPDLRDVGCENCHGPGSEHIASIILGEKHIKSGQPILFCRDCHTPEHSPTFDEDTYMPKIEHWLEPKDE